MAALPDDAWYVVTLALCESTTRRLAGVSSRIALVSCHVHEQLMLNLQALCALCAADHATRALVLPRLVQLKLDATRTLLEKLGRFFPHQVLAAAHIEGVASDVHEDFDGGVIVFPHVTSVVAYFDAHVPLLAHSVAFLRRFPLLRVSHAASVSWESTEHTDAACHRVRTSQGDVTVRTKARLLARTATLARVPLVFTGSVRLPPGRGWAAIMAPERRYERRRVDLVFERVDVA